MLVVVCMRLIVTTEIGRVLSGGLGYQFLDTYCDSLQKGTSIATLVSLSIHMYQSFEKLHEFPQILYLGVLILLFYFYCICSFG
jgi:hypothetical protein